MHDLKTVELETLAGTHISEACARAAEQAAATGCRVHFEFNDTHVTAEPGESAAVLESRWTANSEAAAKAWREDPQREVKRLAREADLARRKSVVMTETARTESELRDAEVPWPLTEKQLNEYIHSLVEREHEYGTCVYAMSMGATAAFYYVAGQLGVTGFQSSCADLDLLRRTRSMKGPFLLIKGEDALYPQYDLPGKLSEAMEEWKPWLKEQAVKKLSEDGGAHPKVIAHWKRLAK